MPLESGARLFEDDDAAVAERERERESSENRTTNSLSDNVEAS
jgi:hypothetical protein